MPSNFSFFCSWAAFLFAQVPMHTLISELPILLLCSYPLILSRPFDRVENFLLQLFIFLEHLSGWCFRWLNFLSFYPLSVSSFLFNVWSHSLWKLYQHQKVLLTNTISLPIYLLILLFFLPLLSGYTNSNQPNALNQNALFFLPGTKLW